MTTTQSSMPGTRPSVCLGTILVLTSIAGLAGCSYLETQQQRLITPDTRIELGWQERVSLYAREIPSYRCEADYSLQCERGGAVTYSCTCVLR
jgi:hypothetical protein